MTDVVFKSDTRCWLPLHLRDLLVAASKKEKKSIPTKLKNDDDKDNDHSTSITPAIPKKRQRASKNNIKTQILIHQNQAYHMTWKIF